MLFRYFGKMFPFPRNLEPIFFMKLVGGTFGLLAAICGQFAVFISRPRSFGIGHLRTSSITHHARPECQLFRLRSVKFFTR
jgi:hypothetical protein